MSVKRIYEECDMFYPVMSCGMGTRFIPKNLCDTTYGNCFKLSLSSSFSFILNRCRVGMLRKIWKTERWTLLPHSALMWPLGSLVEAVTFWLKLELFDNPLGGVWIIYCESIVMSYQWERWWLCKREIYFPVNYIYICFHGIK